MIWGCDSPLASPIAPCVTSNGKPTLRPASWRGWRTRPWMRLLSGMTCSPSTADRGVASWISLLRASRASRGARAGGGWGSKMSVGSGPISPESSERSVQASSSLRTSLGLFGLGSVRCFPILPRLGSMQSGIIFQRAKWGRHTHVSACSFWPTPTASMDRRGCGIPLNNKTGRYNQDTVRRVQALVRTHGWRIHPAFGEALMGFPIGWSGTEPLEMARVQSMLLSHSSRLRAVLAGSWEGVT